MADNQKSTDEIPAVPEIVETPTPAPGGAIPPGGVIDPVGQLEAATRASGGAVAKFVSESQSGGGKRGRKPKNYSPGNDAGEKIGVADNTPPGGLGGGETVGTVPAVYDEKIFSPLIAGFVEMVNGLGVAAQTGLVFNITKDRQFSREAGERAAMGKETRAMANASLLALAKKYSDNMKYAPEVATLVCFGMWAGSNFLQYQMIKKDWQETADALKPTNTPPPVKPGNVN